MSAVTIEFVNAPVAVKVNMSKFTYGEAKKLMDLREGGTDEDVAAAMENIIRLVTGADVDDLPLEGVQEISAAILGRLEALDTKNSAAG